MKSFLFVLLVAEPGRAIRGRAINIKVEDQKGLSPSAWSLAIDACRMQMKYGERILQFYELSADGAALPLL
jgi:hypothetical protein